MNSSAMEEYWINANKALKRRAIIMPNSLYFHGPFTRVWITDASEAAPEPEINWKEFLHEICRFVGGQEEG